MRTVGWVVAIAKTQRIHMSKSWVSFLNPAYGTPRRGAGKLHGMSDLFATC
jgi:hypothetical protein